MSSSSVVLFRALMPVALIVALALPASSALAETADGIPDVTVAKLQAAIRDALPKGWLVSYEKETQWLEIKRTEPLLLASALPNLPPDQEPEKREYLFAFRVRKLVPAANYDQQFYTNSRLEARRNTLYETLVKRHISQKFDSFAPSTDEDKALVAEYEKVKAAKYDLPDFFYDNISLDWAYNNPDRPEFTAVDPEKEKECRATLVRVTGLLSRYQQPKRHWGVAPWD